MIEYVLLSYDMNKKAFVGGKTDGQPEAFIKKMGGNLSLVARCKVTDAPVFFDRLSKFEQSPGSLTYDFPDAMTARSKMVEASRGILTYEPIPAKPIKAIRLDQYVSEMSVSEAANHLGLSYQRTAQMLEDDCVVIDGDVYRKIAPSKSGTGQGRPAKYPWPSMAVGESVDFGGFREYTRAERAAREYGKRNDIGFEFSADNMTVTRVK